MRSAPVAVLGSALSGMIAGTFYVLVPGWMQGEGDRYEDRPVHVRGRDRRTASSISWPPRRSSS